MKRILVILSLALAVAACHKPEYVLPTAERQGITSLTAYFTFGQYEDQELAKLDISNPDISRFVIPVPYYYPETSDDETEIYMIKVRLRAELQPNCSITPPLSIVDLTEENHFTYTDASGASRDIVITGERVHSSKAQLMTFDIVDPPISGIIDEESHKVSLVSADDLSAAVAKVSISAHASISPDPAEPHDYNNGFTFTVTAANGVDKTEYTVVKEVPEKIDYGFNSSSVKQLFNLDPVSNAGMPPYTDKAYISLAVTGNNLVVSTGDGAPSYFNKLTGVKIGAVNTGSATVASVTSDEGGNLLMFNHVDGGGEFSIWKSSSVSEEPTLFHSFTNSSDLPMGYKVKVIGDVNADAQIVATLEGIDGITSSSKFWSLKVEGGKVVSETLVDASATGMAAGIAASAAGIAAAVAAGAVSGLAGVLRGLGINGLFLSSVLFFLILVALSRAAALVGAGVLFGSLGVILAVLFHDIRRHLRILSLGYAGHLAHYAAPERSRLVGSAYHLYVEVRSDPESSRIVRSKSVKPYVECVIRGTGLAAHLCTRDRGVAGYSP